MEVLVLGDGLLGKELVKQSGWDSTSRKHGFDIDTPADWNFKEYDTLVNCIANTDTYSGDKESHLNVNVRFVLNLIQHCVTLRKKLVHISTDYVYANSVSNASEEDVPVHCATWYGYSKLVGDGLVQVYAKDYLVCRCSHKKSPFPYDMAWTDQVGNFDYEYIIARIIIDMVKKNLKGVYNVGTDLKTMYQLASRTRQVIPTVAPLNIPKDVSMDITKLKGVGL